MSREAFEAWLNPGHHKGNVSPWVEPGRYQKETHQLAWLAWQAAQADAYERIAQIFDRRAKQANTPARMMEAQDDAYAIRALAKEAANA